MKLVVHRCSYNDHRIGIPYRKLLKNKIVYKLLKIQHRIGNPLSELQKKIEKCFLSLYKKKC